MENKTAFCFVSLMKGPREQMSVARPNKTLNAFRILNTSLKLQQMNRSK